MSTLLDATREIMSKLKEQQQDETFIQNEKEAFEKRIESANERIKNRKNEIQQLEDREFFVNVSDVIVACAREWGCKENDLSYLIYSNRNFELNDADDAVLKSVSYRIYEMRLKVQYKDKKFICKVPVYKDDVQADGKTFQEHLRVIRGCENKILIADDAKQIIFRYALRDIINVINGKIEFRSENDKIVSRAIRRREERQNDEESEIK